MYKKDFDKLEKLPNFLCFFGDEFYLQEYEKKILDRFKDANILKMYYDEFDFEKAKIHLNEPSLFGGDNVLIIKDNKIPQNIEKLANNTSYLFFFYYGKNQPKFKNVVRFFKPDIKELVNFIDKKTKELNISLTNDAKMFLIKSVEPSFLENELIKLSLFKNEITLDDVKNLVFLYKEDSFEDVIVSILKGEDFEKSLNNLLEKIDFRYFLSAFIKYVKDLYKYNLYIKKTGNNSLKEFLGYQLPFDIEKNRVNLAIKFKEKEYFYLLKNLLDFELRYRQGKFFKDSLMYEVISFFKLNFKNRF